MCCVVYTPKSKLHARNYKLIRSPVYLRAKGQVRVRVCVCVRKREKLREFDKYIKLLTFFSKPKTKIRWREILVWLQKCSVCCDCIDVHFLFLWLNRSTLTSKSINYCHNTASKTEAIFLFKTSTATYIRDEISRRNALNVCLIWYFFPRDLRSSHPHRIELAFRSRQLAYAPFIHSICHRFVLYSWKGEHCIGYHIFANIG